MSQVNGKRHRSVYQWLQGDVHSKCGHVKLVYILLLFAVLIILSVMGLYSIYPAQHGIIHSSSAADLSRNRNIPAELIDAKHGIKMGISHAACDDGKTNLTVDWCDQDEIYSPICAYEYTNFQPGLPIEPDRPNKLLNGGIVHDSMYRDDHIPDDHFPHHFCMESELVYDQRLPSVGPHRPLWPVFGEYLYVPPQRWLHSVEHGSIVFLYHPDVAERLIDEVKNIVKSCIRKHVITPYRRLLLKRPLALVAWSNVMEFAKVDADEIVKFIKTKALHGPEGRLSTEGQYDVALIDKAAVPPGSDYDDSVLCPNY